MRTQIIKRYETLRRVREFGVTYASDFANQPLAKEQFAAVSEAVIELDNLAVNQSSSGQAARSGTSSKTLLREELHDDLLGINRTARAMAIDLPGLEGKFRMPRGSAGDQALLTAARTFAADAVPLAEEFIRHAMPPDFLDELKKSIADFETTLDKRATAKGAKVAATAALESALERGMIAVRKLDAIIKNKFRGDAAKLAAWATASHTERMSRPAAPPVNNPPPQPPPQQ